MEVFHQSESQHTGHADGDEGVAGKVAVNLEGEEQRGHKIGAAVVHRDMVEHGIDIESAAVGKGEFHKIAPGHQPQAAQRTGVVKPMVLAKLRQQVVGTFYRAGHQLREERHEEGVGGEVAFNRCRAAIDVDGVTQSLERVERDAHGEQQAKFGERHAEAHGIEGRLYVGGQELVVFEQEED